jgi:hypothetical protein
LVDSLPALIDAVKSKTSGFYALSKNYAAKEKPYNGPPIKVFSGSFEGLGHTISNLTIKFSTTKKFAPPAALFSISKGTVRDIGLQNETVVSVGWAAGLVGENDGAITQSYTTGSLLAGANATNTDILVQAGWRAPITG